MKDKMKSLALWLVIGVLGVGAVGSVALALTGNFPIGIENCNNCSFVVEKAKDVVEGVLGASGSRFPNGISADSTSPSAGQVRGTTLTVTDDATVSGDTRTASLVQTGSVTSFATGTTVTGAQFCDSRVWLLTKNTDSNPAVTLTLPSSESLSSDCLSTAGDVLAPITIRNLSTTTYTIAAGTSSTLKWSIATTTIENGVSAELTAFRTSTGAYAVNATVFAN